MAALNLTESVDEKLDLILLRLLSLDSRIEELKRTVKGLQEKVSSLELEVIGVKQGALVKNFSHMEDLRTNKLNNYREVRTRMELA